MRPGILNHCGLFFLLSWMSLTASCSGPAEPSGAQQQVLQWGILDVTQPPYSADPSGRADSTAAIQRAVDQARDSRMVAYFPPGTYLVSNTIIANQQNQKTRDNPLLGRRDDFPCVLWGGTRGGRARIVLADEAPGFDDPEHPKPVLYSLSYKTPDEADNPNISFTLLVISLVVGIGTG